ncbi:MAG: methyltransferase domain-containing protein [Candidatus Thermoplasmatota archaeon]|nr:methyltransferase domain-containing protein [Euryarchaeota archaeon]MBU4031288.1 methyltransferase domain-containing protein [Candidatus Thermoplasmatota archaeon]MBU4071221.1 methyltransferase domain-containing protein [Candidatus Thermoplasmatota archaeon]MBU4145070.1 methyltransferase domain-containing protein [Candidatus Thermoplasmatota archaeon]MBU4592788.1 methyltransferase domain-containing protein [Candidatus Thermoplasmatota archaeon]
MVQSEKNIINAKPYAAPMENGNVLVLVGRGGKRYLVRSGQGMKEIAGLGVVDTSRLTESLPSGSVSIAGKEFFLAEASLPDMLSCLKRGAQIIMPKDAAQIVMNCGIGPGKKVLEVGTGSASLTLALAHFVGSGGKVITYESNPKHARNAWGNIQMSGMDSIVEMREADASTCTDESMYDAVIMDMPEPWVILDAMTGALKTGGYICAYIPTMNQAETVIKAMREMGYSETHVLENIQREIVVGSGGTRPSFEMLGHTGYLCFGRKIMP